MEADGRRSSITAGVRYDYVIVCTVGPGQVRSTTHGTRLGGTLVILAPIRLLLRTYLQAWPFKPAWPTRRVCASKTSRRRGQGEIAGT